jgi:D-serine deaminase-like pyridoxal phosphate-dependent protein
VKHLAEALAGLHGRIDTPEPVLVLDVVQSNIARVQSLARDGVSLFARM